MEFYRKDLLKKQGREKEYVARRTFKSFPNEYIYVFSLPDLKWVGKIKAIPGLEKIVSVPEDNRLFCKPSIGLADFNNKIVVLNTKTGEMEANIPLKALNTISYAGNHKLFISTREKLVILNTATLKVEKEFSGYYAPISVRY